MQWNLFNICFLYIIQIALTIIILTKKGNCPVIIDNASVVPTQTELPHIRILVPSNITLSLFVKTNQLDCWVVKQKPYITYSE
jgi:hypothetical protein